MKTNLRNELILMLLVGIPFIYLAMIWSSLPEKVPLHWNIRGEIDRWGSKSELILIPVLLPLLTYVVMRLIPVIDPKKNFTKMGAKYEQLKFILIAFMSGLALYIIYATKIQSIGNFSSFMIVSGFLIMIIGNYFKTIKPNYFIGIRTPWTLEHESVWKATHLLGGKLWFAGGLLIILLSLFVDNTTILPFFFTILGIIILIPLIYSYIKARNL